MVGRKNSDWGATRIWHGRTPLRTLPVMVQPFFLFSVFAKMVPPFSPFLLADFAYACEAWIGIKPSVVYFRYLFTLRPSRLNQSLGCISFISTAGTEDDFIDL
jgi:hypothetical protein